MDCGFVTEYETAQIKDSQLQNGRTKKKFNKNTFLHCNNFYVGFCCCCCSTGFPYYIIMIEMLLKNVSKTTLFDILDAERVNSYVCVQSDEAVTCLY